MTVDEAQSEIETVYNAPDEDDQEEYETVSISETNEQRYDEKMDLYQEKQALLKIKGIKIKKND